MILTDKERELLVMIRESDNPKRTLNLAIILALTTLQVKDNPTIYKALDKLREHEEEHLAFVKLLGNFALNGDIDGGVKAAVAFVENFAKGDAFVA